MRAATQFNRPGTASLDIGLAAHLNNTHLIAVFLAEQRQRAKLDRRIRRHDAGRYLTVHPDAFIHDGLHTRQLFARHSARMREIKTQPVGRDKRAFLRHMIAKNMTERLVKKVRRRMIGAQAAAAAGIDIHAKRLANRQRSLFDLCLVNKHAGRRLEGIGDGRPTTVPGNHPAVALLAT